MDNSNGSADVDASDTPARRIKASATAVLDQTKAVAGEALDKEAEKISGSTT